MEKFYGFLLVTSFLISINFISFGLIFAIGKSVLDIYPRNDYPGFGYIISGLALGIIIAYIAWLTKPYP